MLGKETIFIFDQHCVYHSIEIEREKKVIIGGLNGMRRERKFLVAVADLVDTNSVQGWGKFTCLYVQNVFLK